MLMRALAFPANLIRNEGVLCIAKALEKNSTLEALDVGGMLVRVSVRVLGVPGWCIVSYTGMAVYLVWPCFGRTGVDCPDVYTRPLTPGRPSFGGTE